MTQRETPATAVDPSIAVVIMAYNRPVQILETIDSLLAQERSLSSIAAVYLADDCSKDNTVAAAMQRWTSSVPLTLLQPPKNAGTWGNVNHAIAKLAPKHDWVLLLHDDDMVKPAWLTMMCDRIRTCTPPTLTICSSWDSLHPDGTTVPGEDNPAREIEVIAGGDSAVRSTLLRGCWWHFSGCAIRTRGFLDVGVFDPAYPQCADQDWLMRGLDRGWSVDYIPRTLLIYREHRGSLSSRSFLVHQDLVEQLMLVSRFGTTLSKGESLRFHLQLVKFAARRAVRATLQRRPQVLINAVKLIPRCASSWLRGPRPGDPADGGGSARRHSGAVSA